MRILLTGLTLMAAVLAVASVVGQEEKNEPDSFWMKKKLAYSQSILGGVATEDFEAIRKSATAMRRLSTIESFARRKDTQAYRTQLQIFEFANDELIRLAEEQNIEGAALAFTQLTLSCVNCHKQLRDLQE